RAARRRRDCRHPDVRGVARDGEKVDALAEPPGRLDELRIDLARRHRAAGAVHLERQPPVIPDHHRRVAGVPVLRDEPLGDAMHARLEVHRRLWADAAEYPDRLHAWISWRAPRPPA